MRAVWSLAFRWVLLCSGVALGLAVIAGSVRILPWLLAPGVPLAVTLPFARALAGVAIETAFVLGAPVGVALAATVLVRRGEARALFALGVSPERIALAALPVVVALGVAAVAAQRVADPEPNAPGRFAAALISQARTSCRDAHSTRSVAVPMLGVSWLCFPDALPRIAGRVPGGLRSAWFSARDLHPSDTLTEFALSDARVAFPRTASLPETHVSVAHLIVRGLPPWGHVAHLDPIARGFVIAASVWLSALVSMWLVLRTGFGSALGGLLVAGAGALVMLTVLHALDRAGSPVLAYVSVALSGAATAAAVALAVPRIGSLLRRARPGWGVASR